MIIALCRSRAIGSWLIRQVTWSHWSHVAIVDGDSVIEAAWPRVRERSLAELIESHDEVALVEFKTDVDGDILKFARSQVGKKYDAIGVLGIGWHRDWQSDDAWWCSELPAWACDMAGAPVFRREAMHRVVPEHWWMLASTISLHGGAKCRK